MSAIHPPIEEPIKICFPFVKLSNTELAKQMIGKKIRTTVWKPERYNVLRWWNNIHDVGDTFDDTEN